MELCIKHHAGLLKKSDCWDCKTKEEQKKLMDKVFGKSKG